MRKRPLLWIFVLALALRLTLVIATADLPIGLDDMFQYDMLARSVAAGHGYRWYAQDDLDLIQRYIDMEPPPDYDPIGIPTSFRPPLYPAFLAIIYAIRGAQGRWFAARLVQAVLGAALSPMTALLGRQLGASERAARWGAIAIAFYPLLVFYPLALATEVLYTPLLTLSLWAVLRAGKKSRDRDYVLAGLLLGLTALTRSIVTFFVPLVALWAWWITRPRKKGFRQGALLILCFLLIILPWVIRNSNLHGEFTFIENALGYQLYQGYHPDSTGTFSADFSLDLIPIMDDGERNHRGMEAVRSFIQADPGRVPYLMFRKLGYFWGLDRRAMQYFYSNNFFGAWPSWGVVGALILLCTPLVLIAPAGLAGLSLTKPRRETALIALLLVYYVGVHMLILAEPRFHVPLLPLLSVLAGLALCDHPWKQAARWQKGLALLVILLLFANWGWELVRDREVLLALIREGGNKLHLSY